MSAQYTPDGSAPPGDPGADRSIGELIGEVAKDLSTLMRQELELAKVEMKQEAAKAGKGAGMLGGAGVAGLLTLILASFALSYLLDNWMPVELAFLITTLLWGVVAAVLAALEDPAEPFAQPALARAMRLVADHKAPVDGFGASANVPARLPDLASGHPADNPGDNPADEGA